MNEEKYKLLTITNADGDVVYGIGVDPLRVITAADLIVYLEGLADSFGLKIIEVPDFKPAFDPLNPPKPTKITKRR